MKPPIFCLAGLLSVIPAGTPSAKIASFEKQSSAKFQLQGLVLNNLQQLSFQRTGSDNDGPHTFDIKYGTAFPKASSSATWTDSAELANLLNSGVLKSTANVSMADLGIRVSGREGNLRLFQVVEILSLPEAELPLYLRESEPFKQL